MTMSSCTVTKDNFLMSELSLCKRNTICLDSVDMIISLIFGILLSGVIFRIEWLYLDGMTAYSVWSLKYFRLGCDFGIGTSAIFWRLLIRLNLESTDNKSTWL
jgi:hypothetical protein